MKRMFTKPITPTADATRRFFLWVSKRPGRNGCWEWTGNTTSRPRGTGYGGMIINGKRIKAHRYSFAAFNGPLIPGLTIHHKCYNTLCVNPDHLVQLTNKENILDGNGFTAKNARKTHCPRGHAYSEENIYWHTNRNGLGRLCKTCMRAKDRLRQRSKPKEQK